MNRLFPPAIPKTGLAGLKENWLSDLPSGFLVFLIALPLCLGIAVASGFPPSAGIITAIIGGVLVSRISGSCLTINGPAAGLIVVILAAVQALGAGDTLAGYRYTLAAIVVASVLQVLMGRFKLGQLSSFFPTSVVHGMLAAIGIIIIATQTHVMLGVTPEPGNLLSIIAQIPHSSLSMNLDCVLISFLGLLILIIWPLSESKIPAPVIVVLMGIALASHFGFQDAATSGSNYLVAIPDNFLAGFYFPDFSKMTTMAFWEAVLSISLVGSLESLLSTTAVDKLDPYKRTSDLDRDLTAIGLGNLVAGMIGGLPMIAEIVRSSANINNGAKTAWANFFHGLILLLFVVFFTGFIQSIPLAALATLLVYTGYRLASPKTFTQALDVGKEQLLLFVVTLIGILATDLLIGVTLGIVVKLAINLARGVWLGNLFKIHFTIQQQDNNNTLVIKLLGSALFSNILPLKKALAGLEQGKTIIFDFSDGYLIDHTVMTFIHDFQQNYEAQGGHCRQVGSALETFSDHALAARLMTADDRK